MALWDITVDSVPVVSSSGNWAIDGFENAHVVPVRKDFVSKSPLSPGAVALLGPYDTFTFGLSGWVEADTDIAAEHALVELLSFFGSPDGKPAMLQWWAPPPVGEGDAYGWRGAEVRVLVSNVTASGSGRGYRFKIALENLWGAWYAPVRSTSKTAIGTAVQVPSGPWPTYRAEVTITGPVTNPTLVCGDAPAVRYNGTVAAGSTLVLRSFPPQVFLNGNSGPLADCVYTARWGYLFNLTPFGPGVTNWDKPKVTGTGTTGASGWSMQYQTIRL